MNRPLVLLLFLGLILVLRQGSASAVPDGGYAHPEILIQADELKTLLDRKDPHIRIIDVRHNAKYYLGHIPGALQVWRPQLEGKSPGNPGLLPSRAQVEDLLGRLGVEQGDTLILYADQFDHTRFWFILVYYGFPPERLRLLDGGLEAWKSKGLPTQITAPRTRRTAFQLPDKSPLPALVATLADIKRAMHDPRKALVDNRPRREYLGMEFKDGATRPGHIPGAVGLHWKEDLVPAGPAKGYWQSLVEIKHMYAARGVTADKDIYLYAHNGLPATHSLVALYLAGFPLERLHLYEGSWVEWSRSQEAAELGDPTPAPPVKTGKPEKFSKRGSREKKEKP